MHNIHYKYSEVVRKGFRARKGEITQSIEDRKIGDEAVYKTTQCIKS